MAVTGSFETGRVDNGLLRRDFVEFVPSVRNSGLLRPYFREKRAKTGFLGSHQRNRAFLAAIFPENANWVEITAQNAAIITGGKKDCG